MLLDQLLYEINIHYISRGFPESALEHLRWTLITSTYDDVIDLSTAYHKYKCSVSDLIGYFKPAASLVTNEDIGSAQAVFGFAFGYQMASWSLVHKPANRLPGLNNEALADIADNLNKKNNLPLYLQFEIAAAKPAMKCVKKSEVKDQGTIAVANEFVEEIKRKKANIQTVVIVAHRHHVERCRLILNNNFNLNGLPYNVEYDKYDPSEAQPRVMSSSQCIVSDFVSMAVMRDKLS